MEYEKMELQSEYRLIINKIHGICIKSYRKHIKTIESTLINILLNKE